MKTPQIRHGAGYSWSGIVSGAKPLGQMARVNAPTFRCPSESEENRLVAKLANLIYVANAGPPRHLALPVAGSSSRSRGIISHSRVTNGHPKTANCSWAFLPSSNNRGYFSDVIDGLSNTAAISKCLINDGAGNSRDVRRNLFYTNSARPQTIGAPIASVVQDGLANLANWAGWSCYKGISWLYTSSWEKHLYNHVFPPNTISIPGYNTDWFRCSEADGAISPGANDPGHVRISMAAGSVRFVKDSINIEIWWAIGSSSSGKLITEFQAYLVM